MKISLGLKALLALMAIMTIFAGITFLVIKEVFDIGAFFLAFCLSYLLSFPIVDWIKTSNQDKDNQNIRLLNKYLPKVGFVEESRKLLDDGITYRIYGKVYGENFAIDASSKCTFVQIHDLPWSSIHISNPNMPMLMEAANEVNSIHCSMSVILTDPDKDGIRSLYTTCSTLLPSKDMARFLEATFTNILNRKSDLEKCFYDRPWLHQNPRNPIGFASSPTEKDGEAQKDPIAAKLT